MDKEMQLKIATLDRDAQAFFLSSHLMAESIIGMHIPHETPKPCVIVSAKDMFFWSPYGTVVSPKYEFLSPYLVNAAFSIELLLKGIALAMTGIYLNNCQMGRKREYATDSTML